MIESNRIEFKRELTRELDIEREVIAFLNYREGGTIYIGIDDAGTPVGVQDIDSDMLKIKDRIRMGVSPSPMGLFDVQSERINGIQVIKITVASGAEKPYYKPQYGMSPRGCFIRVGTAVEQMPQDMIDRLYASRTRHSLSRIVSNRQDLSFEQLRIYYSEHGKPLNDNFARTLELLTKDGQYNYVAYLLADENGNSIKVAKYSSLDRCDLIENNEYGYCSLIKATKSVLAKLEVENKTAATITPVERIETPLWDRVALREAVINAIVHNDYSFEVPPKFEIFPDRLEITSAGRLPETMTMKEFYEGVSLPRNKELMRIYKDVELVESLGSGIPRILRAYGEDCFHFTENFIRLVLPIAKHSATIDALNGGKDVAINVAIELTDRQRFIYKIIKENVALNVALNTKYLSDKIGVNRKTIQRDLLVLKDKGLIEWFGSKKMGVWRLKE
ncbi:MAG: putative DNA binding domain-containing protein [Paludibacteraceae bacterium]|nr:putative DNA binding domain-containing protein [Paludibacteraceae bacterium]